MHLAQKEQNTGVGDSYAPLATQNELNEFCDSWNGMGMVGAVRSGWETRGIITIQ